MAKLIALSGSLRSESFNQKLVQIAAEGARAAGAEVQVIHLADFNIPLYSQDLEEEGMPAAVNDLKHLFAQADGILLASPEYNGSITGVLKNTLDWLSRPSKDPSIGSAFDGKVAGIMAASPGGLGGIRGLAHTKDVLFNLGVMVYPKQVAVGSAFKAFDQEGNLVDEDMAQRVKGLGAAVAELAAKIAG